MMKKPPLSVLCGLLLAGPGCLHPVALPAEPMIDESTTTPPSGPGAALVEVARSPMNGLQALACSSESCFCIVENGLQAFSPASLMLTGNPMPLGAGSWELLAGGDGFMLLGTPEGSPISVRFRVSMQADLPVIVPFPTLPTAANSPPEADSRGELMGAAVIWRQAMDKGWRLPFVRAIPVPGGGVVTYMRGPNPMQAVLMRVGSGVRQVNAPGTLSPVTSEEWLVIDPQAKGLHLVLWPETHLWSYDPTSLHLLGQVDFQHPVLGLFLDPDGRQAILAETPPPDGDALVEPLKPAFDPTQTADPRSDRAMGIAADRAASNGVLLVDVQAHAVVAHLDGAFRAWVALSDGQRLLASQKEVIRLASTH